MDAAEKMMKKKSTCATRGENGALGWLGFLEGAWLVEGDQALSVGALKCEWVKRV